LADDKLLEVYKQHLSAQDKLGYFLLAVTASAIAFAVQKSEGVRISSSAIPLAAAGISWAFSFYFGIRRIRWTIVTLYANIALLQFQTGVHPQQPSGAIELQAAIQGIREAAKTNMDGAESSGKKQDWLFICGTALFIVWISLRMYISTFGSLQFMGVCIK